MNQSGLAWDIRGLVVGGQCLCGDKVWCEVLDFKRGQEGVGVVEEGYCMFRGVKIVFSLVWVFRFK